MKNILIRKAIIDDADGISALIKNSMGYFNPPEIIRENLCRVTKLNTDSVIVAIYKDEIIGLAHAENYDSLYSPPLKFICDKEKDKMNIELEILKCECRIALLKERNRDNGKIIQKLERRLRNLKNGK